MEIFNPCYIAIGIVVGACVTVFWYAYVEYKEPFRRPPSRW